MASVTTIDDLGLDLLQSIVSRLPALSFASAACVTRSWNLVCGRLLCRPKLSSACSFNSSIQVAVEDVVNKVLSEPIRPQFAVASVGRCLCDLQEAYKLITAKLGSRVPLIINYSRGIVGSDVSSDEFKETRWFDNASKGIMLTVGFVPGLKVKPVSLLKQVEDRQTLLIDQFITDIREFSTSVSGCQSPAAIMLFTFRRDGMIALMEKLDYSMSMETVIVGDCGCIVTGECGCGIEHTVYDEHVVAVALVFVMDSNKPPDTGETKFHAVLSSGLSPVGPTYKVDLARQNANYTIMTNLTGLIEGPPETFEEVEFPDVYIIGVTKRRMHSIGQEEAKWMTALSFHEIIEEEGDELVVLDDVGIKTGDTYQYYFEDSNTARSSNLLRSFKQRNTNGHDKWEVCGSLIFTCEYRAQHSDSSAFRENFPGVTLGGTLCFKEIGRGDLTTQESQEERSARTSLYSGSAVYFIISYAP